MDASTLIREARLRAGLTQDELAGKAGVAQSAISRWENGRARPSLDTLAEIVRACGLELRVGLSEADPDEERFIEEQLRLTPAERLEQLARTVRFIGKARASATTRG